MTEEGDVAGRTRSEQIRALLLGEPPSLEPLDECIGALEGLARIVVRFAEDRTMRYALGLMSTILGTLKEEVTVVGMSGRVVTTFKFGIFN